MEPNGGVDALKELQQAIKASEHANLPLEEDHYFYINYPEFKEKVGGVMGQIQSLLAAFPGATAAAQDTFNTVADAQEWVTPVLDEALARVDDALADSKRPKRKEPPAGEAVQALPSAAKPSAGAPNAAAAASVVAGRPAATLTRGQRAQLVTYMQNTMKEKPQEAFEDTVDNSNEPFVHSIKHLGGSIDVEAATAAAEAARAAGEPRAHPLQAQLDSLRYPEWETAVPATPHAYRSFEDTPYTYIDTMAALEAAGARLAVAKEVAVDLEAHSYRSFHGFCCLMQLSTREEDLIVDVLALRPHVGRVLAPIFANSQIVKILHGSDGDIVWLQRDFGIYVVNMFDTGQAVRALNYPAHGLGYLLEKMCNFKADKRYQLADWRLRPLSAEALHYARADTHFLLHCYDRLRAELVAAGPNFAMPTVSIGNGLRAPVEMTPPAGAPGGALGSVLERSRRLCLQQYEKDLVSDISFLELYGKLQQCFTDEQLAVFAALYAWRDRVAREEDESLGFVLSRNHLMQLAQGRPITVAEFSRLVSRGAEPAHRRVKEVLALISAAKSDAARVAEVAEKRRQWRDEAAVKGRTVEGTAQASGGVLPDMAAAAAAAAASVGAPPPPPPPSPPPPQQPAAAAAEGLKPKILQPLATGGGMGGMLGGLGAPAAAASPSLFSIQPKASLVSLQVAHVPAGAGLGAKKLPPLAATAAGRASAFGSALGGGSAAAGVSLFAAKARSIMASLAPPPGFQAPVSAPETELGDGAGDAGEAGAAEGGCDSAADKQAAVRAAVNQLAAEQAGEGSIPAAAAEEDAAKVPEELEEFLPLALSAKYALKQSRKQRRQQQQQQKPKQQQQKQPPAKKARVEGGGGDGAATKAKLRELGLESGSDVEEGEIEGGDEDAAAVAPMDVAAAASKYNLGIINPHSKAGRGGKGRGRGGGRGGRGEGRGQRGRGGGGRGGRDSKEPAGIPEGRFNPYAALDLSGIKGGKRSAVHIRAGNKSSSYK